MTPTILLVDDEPQFERLVRQRLRQKIKAGAFKMLFASDGVAALKILQEHQGIEMVLTDINMPKMDGLMLIGEIRKAYPLLKSVVISAYGDMKNIRTAMNLGAFDFLTKPIDFQDLEKTISKTLEEAVLLRQIEQAKALEQEKNQLIELDQMKSHFFTNISHEFRTPLTVISGMNHQIKSAPVKWLDKGTTMIERNATHLLNLVNQILDLRKLESGKLQLNIIQGDALPLINYLAESFQTIAESRDIKLHYLNTTEEIILDHDAEKLQRIISNLLSNAIKFTPACRDIYLMVDSQPNLLKLIVKDTGVGIPETQLPNVFNRFFQAENEPINGQKGTGIGLALTKELVHLMGGAIQVVSQINKGTTFTVSLPVFKNASIKSNTTFPEPQPTALLPNHPLISPNEVVAGVIAPELPTVLLIEDHPDVAQYIMTCLADNYQVDWAKDGEIGIKKALSDIPDLVISDVMMPNKNGYEVCETLKNDPTTNHIPIILLTAKASEKDKTEGLSRGADAYISKPFDQNELLIRLANLLAIREKLRKRYIAEEITPTIAEPQTPEEIFMAKVRAIIEEKMEDYRFDGNQLCKDMMMSRTLLFLKLKAMTGYSASLYIRLLRLQRAKKLLLTTDLNVSQAAYEVGFKDPKYFSRVFSEEFGIPPSKV